MPVPATGEPAVPGRPRAGLPGSHCMKPCAWNSHLTSTLSGAPCFSTPLMRQAYELVLCDSVVRIRPQGPGTVDPGDDFVLLLGAICRAALPTRGNTSSASRITWRSWAAWRPADGHAQPEAVTSSSLHCLETQRMLLPGAGKTTSDPRSPCLLHAHSQEIKALRPLKLCLVWRWLGAGHGAGAIPRLDLPGRMGKPATCSAPWTRQGVVSASQCPGGRKRSERIES